jgi:hypothetical protein
MSTELVVAPQSGVAVTQGFGTREIELRAETATAAVAAQAKAAVEARYILAMQRPRDIEDVRVKVLKECKRPGFAESAMYRLPRGGKAIEGLSIRFAEAAIRCMTNVMPETSVIYEDQNKRILQIMVTDLEANVTYTSQIVIQKTVERRKAEGREIVGERVNTGGDVVYIVAATEDELLMKQNALVSKALRTNALRLIPGDILDEAEGMIRKTLRDAAAKDPDAEKRRIIDSFADNGIQASDLAVYIGHSLDRIQPAEMVELRQVYSAIRSGEATWDSIMESKGTTGSQELQDDVRDKKLADLQSKQPGFKLSSKEPKS